MTRPAQTTFMWPERIRTMFLALGSKQTLQMQPGFLIFLSIIPCAVAKSWILINLYPVLKLMKSFRYPVRDPFFKMLPRSLSNFMNAFTSSDHTTYPFATTNKQDFQNLLSVYLDATLHPLLKGEDFRQEGWRLGPENP